MISFEAIILNSLLFASGEFFNFVVNVIYTLQNAVGSTPGAG